MGVNQGAENSFEIRRYQDSDWPQLWPLLKTIFSAGDTYAFSPDISEQEANSVWVGIPSETYVVVDEAGQLLGSYYIKPNQPGLGAHVCNCGYLVSSAARGQGLATRMCKHSQQRAIELGFRAMQFNLVVSTNRQAVRLWQKLGFDIVGTLPGAFHSRKEGFVDAFVMYKGLGS